MSADLSERDLALISAWLYGPTHIADLAAEHELSLPQLAAWAARPDIAAILSAMRAFNSLRAQDLALACKSAALTRLIHIVEHSDDEQSVRRAATAILRFNPRADSDHPKPGRATTPPIPTPPPPAAPAPPPPPAAQPRAAPPPSRIHPPAPPATGIPPSQPGQRSTALASAPEPALITALHVRAPPTRPQSPA
ncbi:MAG: hypothetical protein IT436_18900 [Phycisphaerales bacterium]|nr:hypothetical protein [Phycisphaerales bacterium]